MLWVPITIGAAVTQLVRNALQSGLTGTVGTLGATMVRFLYAIPFALAAYAVAMLWLDQPMPGFSEAMIGWVLTGAVVQLGATALMLKAMHMRGFAVAYAYIKTEPVLLALGGWWLLGDRLPLGAWAGILIATFGVLWAAVPRGGGLAAFRGEAAPVLFGVTSGAMFGLSSLSFRAAILTLPGAAPWMAALHVMTCALIVQSTLLLVWLGLTDKDVIVATLRAWKPSLGAGATGMLATLMWFTGLALTAAANVRTLGLIEMPLAALLNRRVSGRHLGRQEWTGLALVGVGIALLLQAVV
ncbi:EamA family transporter [Altererythrobacter fulvus]|uniref:EamA family transporter n=1 Tax=Caenibius fulvus TaxID=2126012 RepID=UPI00301962BA